MHGKTKQTPPLPKCSPSIDWNPLRRCGAGRARARQAGLREMTLEHSASPRIIGTNEVDELRLV
jgi:hypothetical protein